MAIKWASRSRLQSVRRGRRTAGNALHPRLMARRFEEFQQVLSADRRGHGVVERMKIEGGVLEQRRVKHDGDAAVGVVNRAERRYRARLDAQHLAEQIRRAERKPAGTKPVMQALELDR